MDRIPREGGGLSGTLFFLQEIGPFHQSHKFMDIELYSFIIFLMSMGSVVISFLSFLRLVICVFLFYWSVWLEVYHFY